MPDSALTIFLSGMLAGVPHQGGATWAVLQYVLGLRRLGHDVYFVEPVDAATLQASTRYFHAVTAEFDLRERSALLLAGTRETVGLSYEVLQEAARRADVLINISGMLADEALLAHVPVRLYLDLDPAFNQLWSAIEQIDMRLDGHTHFATVGLALGRPACKVPTLRRQWIPTLQPVVLDRWPRAEDIVYDGLTTVANWRGYGSIEHEGVFYGQKAHSLRRFLTLPTRTTERFMLALAIHPAEVPDLQALDANGWQLLDPMAVAGSPSAYRAFIQGSKAEFGIAKSGYVVSRCGWFSDRSACYLASGRPVIAQETGFSRYLPTGAGLFAFETDVDILAAVDALRSDYRRQGGAAREIAEGYFNSDRVLTKLLERLSI